MAEGVTHSKKIGGTGSNGIWQLSNLSVHNNTINLSAGGANGVVEDNGDTTIFTSAKNNIFMDNSYTLGTNLSPFRWNNQSLTASEWTATGQEKGGSFH